MISTHFSLAEATHSQYADRHGLDNTPTQAVLEQLKDTALRMELIRALLKQPIIISSWYRSPAVNKGVGGAKNSQHTTGNAVDFICPQFGTPFDICKIIVRSGIVFDQLIHEYTWVHISFSECPRKEVLELIKGGGYRPLVL